MTEQHGAAFNEAASATFCLEYEREEGQLLRFRATGRPFPDAILATKDGKDIGVEFVSVVLPFVQQEEGTSAGIGVDSSRQFGRRAQGIRTLLSVYNLALP